jgi:hypothetical protein
VVVLGILARVAEGRVDPNQPCGLLHGGGEVRGVLARAVLSTRPRMTWEAALH